MHRRRRALLLEATAAVASPFITVRAHDRRRPVRRPTRHYTSKPIVMVDPDHGGKSPGCIGVHAIEEKRWLLPWGCSLNGIRPHRVDFASP